MKNTTLWVIDPAHTEISFKVRHLMISTVRGVFREFGATVNTNENDFESAKIDLWINSASVDTNEEKRDGHLKSPDFFDVGKFEKITFVSDSFEKSGEENLFKVGGNLTIKGIKRSITLEVEFGGIINDPYGNEKAGFSVKGKIKRNEWGLNWNAAIEAGGVMVSDEVSINCEVELLKQK